LAQRPSNSPTRQAQALTNLSEVLKAAGSSIDNVVKVNIFLTNMENFAAMNKVYDGFFSKEPKPVRTCVAVFQLPLGTDVEIELSAHL
jgi:reactive intermediate/imine deaminase